MAHACVGGPAVVRGQVGEVICDELRRAASRVRSACGAAARALNRGDDSRWSLDSWSVLIEAASPSISRRKPDSSLLRFSSSSHRSRLARGCIEAVRHEAAFEVPRFSSNLPRSHAGTEPHHWLPRASSNLHRGRRLALRARPRCRMRHRSSQEGGRLRACSGSRRTRIEVGGHEAHRGGWARGRIRGAAVLLGPASKSYGHGAASYAVASLIELASRAPPCTPCAASLPHAAPSMSARIYHPISRAHLPERRGTHRCYPARSSMLPSSKDEGTSMKRLFESK